MLWLILLLVIIAFFVVRGRSGSAAQSSSTVGDGGAATKRKIADDLEQLAARPDVSQYEASLRSAVQYLRLGFITSSGPIPTSVSAPSSQVQAVGQIVDPLASHGLAGSEPALAQASVSHVGPQLTTETAFKALENINSLLYLGAFIFVVSASLFVGLGVNSGAFKTSFVVFLAFAFYVLGLWLYLGTVRLKPAGTTFVAIGQILAPLAGLAAYQVMFEQTHGPVIWLLTSVISLIMYAIALVLVKKSYITYFMAFTVVSLYESGVALVGAPIQYFAWGMALLSIAYLFAAAKLLHRPELSEPLTVSAQVFMPASLLLAISQASTNGLFATSVTLVIAAVYYYLAHLLTQKADESEAYLALSALLLPTGLGLVLYSLSVNHIAIAALIAALGIFETLGARLIARQKIGSGADAVATIGGALILAACFVVPTNHAVLMLALITAIGVNFINHRLQKTPSNLLLAIVGLLGLPAVTVLLVLQPNQPNLILALAYFVVGVGILLYRSVLSSWSDTHRQIAILGYGVALAASVGYGLTLEHWFTALSVALVLLSTILAVDIEQRADLCLIPIALSYVLCYEVLSALSVSAANFAWAYLVLGVIMYMVGRSMSKDSAIWRLVRRGGLMSLFLAVLSGLSVDIGQQLAAILSLFVAAAMSYVECRYTNAQENYAYASGALAVLALEWLMYYAGIREFQLFSHIWAIYFAFIAYRFWNTGKAKDSDNWIVAALATMTFPLGIQALSEIGGGYGLLLIFEGIVLVLVGIALHRRTVQYWGIATAVASILYQLRGLWYVTLGAIGLGIIGLAVGLLLRRDQPKL